MRRLVVVLLLLLANALVGFHQPKPAPAAPAEPRIPEVARIASLPFRQPCPVPEGHFVL